MSKQTPHTITLHIGGMTCENCARRIGRAIGDLPGVLRADVSYIRERAVVLCEPSLTQSRVEQAVRHVGYEVIAAGDAKRARMRLWLICAAAVAGYMLLRHSGLMDRFPSAQAGMGLGGIFIVGLLTSVHCVGMCGGIGLSQSLAAGDEAPDRRQIFWNSIQYNLGRIGSYMVIGGAIGALGSVFSLSPAAQGAIQLAAGVFMLIMGANMLGLIPALRGLRLTWPSLFGGLSNKAGGSGPFVVGLLNGLMPCGPLQAMQLYALASGSFVGGALSLLVFGLGTLPLMLGMGALSSFLGKKQLRELMRAGAVLILAMGVGVLGNGLALSGLVVSPMDTQGLVAQTKAGVQSLTTELMPRRYAPITVEVGVPVAWTIHAEQGSLTGCNNRLVIPEYDISAQLTLGDNLITFVPERTGTFAYTCWMGMIRSTITVVDGPVNPTQPASGPVIDVAIPTGGIAVAEIADGVQTVTISVGPDGFDPAIVVMQAGVDTQWHIENLGATTAGLVFPAYGARLILTEGTNTIALTPYFDFDFGAAEKTFFGYVHVVESLADIDLEALRTEVEAHRPDALDYP